LVFSGLSSSIAGVKDLLSAETIPVLTTAAPDAMMYPPQPNIFMFGPTASQNGLGLVNKAEQLAGGDLTGKRLAIITFTSAYSDALIGAINESATDSGFEVVENQSIELGAASAASQAAAIQSANPDYVLMGISGGDAPVVYNALKDAGVTVPVIAYTAASSPTLMKKFQATNYFAAREAQFPSDSPDVAAAAEQSGTTDQAQSSFFTDGWVMADAVAEAATRCKGACDGSELLSIFGDFGEFSPAGDATFGPIILSADSHAGTSALQFFVWDGAAVTPDGDPISVS
jgi:ABC-type branched-subunit amino acid transport system substrate-binding protein